MPPMRQDAEIFSIPGIVFTKDSRKEKEFFSEKRQGAVRCQVFDYFFNIRGSKMKEGRGGNDEKNVATGSPPVCHHYKVPDVCAHQKAHKQFERMHTNPCTEIHLTKAKTFILHQSVPYMKQRQQNNKKVEEGTQRSVQNKAPLNTA